MFKSLFRRFVPRRSIATYRRTLFVAPLAAFAMSSCGSPLRSLSMRRLRVLISSASIFAFVACAGHGASNMLSLPNTAAYAPNMVRERSVDPHSFRAALGKRLVTDADYEKYIDPQIIGSDRKKALRFLKMMPPNQRGDFAFVDSNHKVLSNRVNVAKAIVFKKFDLRSGRVVTDGVSPNFTPPLNDSTGPFIREYSTSGGSAMMGFATVTCGNTNLNPGDGAYMYGGVFAADGQNYDAGLEWYNDNRIVAFITPYQSSGWTNQSATYGCNNHIAVFTGVLAGVTGVIITGIPDEDPTQNQLPPSMVNLTNAAWNFFPMPGNDWKNCSGCVAKRMTTIALGGGNQYGSDTSCFGGCNGYTTNWWDQIVMGQLTDPCQQNPGQNVECTIQYLTDGSWFGGMQNETQTGAATYHSPQDTVNQFQEGINLSASYGPGKKDLKKSGNWHNYASPTPSPIPSPSPCGNIVPVNGSKLRPEACPSPCVIGGACPQSR